MRMYNAPLPSPHAILNLKSTVHESMAHKRLRQAKEQSTVFVFKFHNFTVESVEPEMM